MKGLYCASVNSNELCGILVTFHPDLDFPQRVTSLAAQVGAVVIIDNGSSEAEVCMLRESAAQAGAVLVLNAANLGIASALNMGVRRAASLGYAWVLLLDQDSRIQNQLSATLLAVLASYPEKARLAIVGSGYKGLRGVTDERQEQAAVSDWDEAEYVITSGSLLSVAAYTAIGPFREEFFIDHVDTEYCVRARAAGYHVIRARRALMSHAIGAPSQHRILWTHKWTTNHGADRRYYFARNDTVMLREQGDYKRGMWRLKSLSRCVRTCKRILLYEDAKMAKIKAVAQGWWDANRGRMGPRRPPPAAADSRVSAR